MPSSSIDLKTESQERAMVKILTEEKFQALVEKTGGNSFGVNDFGSCQYTGALNMFNTLQYFYKKRRPGGADCPTAEVARMRQRDATFAKLGLQVTYKSVTPLGKAWKAFSKEMIESRSDKAIWDASDRKEVKEILKAFPSVDIMFLICRDQAWDLWSAAPFIANLMFKDLKIIIPKAPGVGPILNVAVQGENYNTGLCCWLLYNEGLVKDVDVFSGFDT
jgi:hypothetical protein